MNSSSQDIENWPGGSLLTDLTNLLFCQANSSNQEVESFASSSYVNNLFLCQKSIDARRLKNLPAVASMLTAIYTFN